MGISQLKIIDTGLDPLSAPGRQWDDAGNALALGSRVAVCYERNAETNARLEEAGIEVIRVPGSELGSLRGGPRCMSCPVTRDPAAEPEMTDSAGLSGELAGLPPGRTLATAASGPRDALTEPCAGRPQARAASADWLAGSSARLKSLSEPRSRRSRRWRTHHGSWSSRTCPHWSWAPR